MKHASLPSIDYSCKFGRSCTRVRAQVSDQLQTKPPPDECINYVRKFLVFTSYEHGKRRAKAGCVTSEAPRRRKSQNARLCYTWCLNAHFSAWAHKLSAFIPNQTRRCWKLGISQPPGMICGRDMVTLCMYSTAQHACVQLVVTFIKAREHKATVQAYLSE